MAKCYFAKHKLVWEVLEKGLKSKIEIQWSDIMALKANCPEDGPGTLTLVVQDSLMFLSVAQLMLLFNFNLWSLSLCFSLLGSPYFSGKQIHSLESILCGRRHQILPMAKPA